MLEAQGKAESVKKNDTSSTAATVVNGRVSLRELCKLFTSSISCSPSISTYLGRQGVSLELVLKDNRIDVAAISFAIYPSIKKASSTAFSDANAYIKIKAEIPLAGKTGLEKTIEEFLSISIPVTFGAKILPISLKVTVDFRPSMTLIPSQLTPRPSVAATFFVDMAAKSVTIADFNTELKIGDISTSISEFYGDAGKNGQLELSGSIGLKEAIKAEVYLLPEIPSVGPGGLLEKIIANLRVGGIEFSTQSHNINGIIGGCPSEDSNTSQWYYKVEGESKPIIGKADLANLLIYDDLEIKDTKGWWLTKTTLAEKAKPSSCKRRTSTVFAVTPPTAAFVGNTITLSANVAALPPIPTKKVTGRVEMRSLGSVLCDSPVTDSSEIVTCSFVVPSSGTYAIVAAYSGDDSHQISQSDPVPLEIQPSNSQYRFEFIDESNGTLSCQRLLGSAGNSPSQQYLFYADFDFCQRYITPAMRCIGTGCIQNRFFASEVRYTNRTNKSVVLAGKHQPPSCDSDFEDLVRKNRYSNYVDTYSPGQFGWYPLFTSFRYIYPETDYNQHLSGFKYSFRRNFSNINGDGLVSIYGSNIPSMCAVTSQEFEIFVKIFDALTGTYISQSFNINLPSENEK